MPRNLILISVTVLVLLAFFLSFAGRIHGVGDSLAVIRTALCAALFVLCIWMTGRSFLRNVSLLVALFGLGSVLWHKIPYGSPGPISLYQKNIYYLNDDLEGLAQDILAASPDVITLQEISVPNEALLDMLREAYPHQKLCRYDIRSGLAVLSRTAPVGTGFCVEDMGGASMNVPIDGQTYHVVSVHLTWPYPRPQVAQIRDLVANLNRLNGPVLIGGDFNMVPWGRTLPRVARASNTRAASPARTTFLLGSLPISIDHVLAPGGGRTQVRPLLGSDHFGILAEVHGSPQVSENPN